MQFQVSLSAIVYPFPPYTQNVANLYRSPCGRYAACGCYAAEPHSSFGSVADIRSLVRSPALPIFFPRIDDSHCDRIHSSLTAVRCFDNGYVGKQSVVWEEYCAKYWLKELQESVDRCTGHRNIKEILLKTALNTIQSIKQLLSCLSTNMNVRNKCVAEIQTAPGVGRFEPV